MRVRLDEVPIDDIGAAGAALARVERQHVFRDAGHKRDVAAGVHLDELRSDRRRLSDRHLPRILRIDELDETFLFERIYRQDLASALRRGL